MTQFCVLCLLFVLIGCTTDPGIDGKAVFVSATDTQPDDTPLWGEVTFGDPTRNAWGTDAYRLNTPPVITDDVLMLNVSYSGGCEAHTFTLVTTGRFMDSDPVQLQAGLAHHANGDSCEAWITETYHFDLSPLKARYQKMYRTETGTIILSIKGASALVYTF